MIKKKKEKEFKIDVLITNKHGELEFKPVNVKPKKLFELINATINPIVNTKSEKIQEIVSGPEKESIVTIQKNTNFEQKSKTKKKKAKQRKKIQKKVKKK